jgi:GT2 family glycosyltransferase
MLTDVGAVAIGRNEGERLVKCIESLRGVVHTLVYVDSNSTDGSAERARALGCEVVDLDLCVPFTAARARNAGYERLRELSDPAYIQFVDGDCEVVGGWLPRARARLIERPELAVVCGRRRERFPDASVYNRLCDIEWDTPIGDALACGGDAMMRASAFREVGGFDASLIAGEEPELCVRLRRAGWKIERLDAEMTLHDAAMTRFTQWWRRTKRSGHAFAEGASMYDDHWQQETRRIWLWGAVLPAVAIGASVPTLGASLSLLGGYGVSAARVYRAARERGRPVEDAVPYAVFTTLGKFPELQGALEFHANRLRGKRRGLIEYK